MVVKEHKRRIDAGDVGLITCYIYDSVTGKIYVGRIVTLEEQMNSKGRNLQDEESSFEANKNFNWTITSMDNDNMEL